ncbi:MAG: hypothetical protein A2052_04895 [Deltaproteobacteria bacterium GWA2_54_12]|nr:MAG: hypothetical protein A2052_04895 [Deltaproteobacteria bacterium GWA2_54_12]
MIKIDKVMAEGFVLQDKTRRDPDQARESLAAGDKVTISEEGKKRRVMGHVMACLSGPDHKKKV